WVVVCLMFTVVLIAVGISGARLLKKAGQGSNTAGSDDQHKDSKDHKDSKGGQPTAGPGRSEIVKSAGALPRRLLFIQISNYAFLNPLTGAPFNVDKTKGAASRIAFEWKIPTDKDNNQVFLVSDTTLPDRQLVIKPVLQ